MSALLDSSVLFAALASDELKHAEYLARLLTVDNCIYSHALLETFSTLTGGKIGVRVTADFAVRMLSKTVLPRVTVIELSPKVWMDACHAAFAIRHEAEFVTFDQDFRNFEKEGLKLRLLSA
jgi:predicted nucleic acid-binding protein